MIYPQHISGKYRSLKDYSNIALLLIYFLGSWIRWPRGMGEPSQAILMDLEHRIAYIFGIEIWPEELYYLTGILILAALGLFFITSLFGRIWCGYTCPHTVFVDLFVKVETYFQGDRNARIKLDNAYMSFDKFIRKLATHLSWVVIAFSFAFGWVCYFYDAPSLVYDLYNFKVTTGGLTWLLGLTTSTYLFAGFIRERVCTYMCPYGRFQSAMLDNDTTVVTYHDWRGEPRGKLDPNSNLGDCIDCGKCIVVCPMGIDIRNGLQLACIGCGLCIDACNSVMEKINRPLYLIGYDSVNSIKAKMLNKPYKRKFFHTKTTLFGAIFLLVSSLLLYSLFNKEPLKISILHDRAVLFTTLPDGTIRNGYTLKLFNRTLKTKKFLLSIKGIAEASIKLQGFAQEYAPTHELIVGPDEELEIIIFIKIPKDQLKVAEESISFEIKNLEDNKVSYFNSVFVSDIRND
jgi:cytochrome c oxidase accessory protein FixG